jgi:hypothetical protein
MWSRENSCNARDYIRGVAGVNDACGVLSTPSLPSTITPISGLRDASVGKSFRHCALRSIDFSCLGNAGISSAMAPVQAGGAPTRAGRRSSRRLRLRLSPSQSGYRRAGCSRGDRPVGLALSRLRRTRHAGRSGSGSRTLLSTSGSFSRRSQLRICLLVLRSRRRGVARPSVVFETGAGS